MSAEHALAWAHTVSRSRRGVLGFAYAIHAVGKETYSLSNQPNSYALIQAAAAIDPGLAEALRRYTVQKL